MWGRKKAAKFVSGNWAIEIEYDRKEYEFHRWDYEVRHSETGELISEAPGTYTEASNVREALEEIFRATLLPTQAARRIAELQEA